MKDTKKIKDIKDIKDIKENDIIKRLGIKRGTKDRSSEYLNRAVRMAIGDKDDKERLKNLQRLIEGVYKEYMELQKVHRRLTGRDHVWLK